MFYLSVQNKNVKANEKVIVFSSFEQAASFKELFIQYSMLKMLNENFLGVNEVLRVDQSMTIMELTAESGIKDEDIISFENLKK